MSEYLLMFLIANSSFLTIFPLMMLQHTYDSLTDFEREQSRIDVTTLNLFIPISLGILFPILYSMMRSFVPRKVSGLYLRFNLAGALSALLISLVIDNLFGIYTLWFDTNPYTMHVAVFVTYFLLFNVIGVWMYKKIASIFSSSTHKSLENKSSPSSTRSETASVSSRSSEIFDKYSSRS